MHSLYKQVHCFTCCSPTASSHESGAGQLPVLEPNKSHPHHSIHVSMAYYCSLFSSLVSSCSSLNLHESSIAHCPVTPHSVCMSPTDSSFSQHCGSKVHYHWVQTSAATRGKAASTLAQQLREGCLHTSTTTKGRLPPH